MVFFSSASICWIALLGANVLVDADLPQPYAGVSEESLLLRFRRNPAPDAPNPND